MVLKNTPLHQIIRVLLRNKHARAVIKRELEVGQTMGQGGLGSVTDETIIRRLFYQDQTYRERNRHAYINELVRLGGYKRFAEYYKIALSTAKFRGRQFGITSEDYNSIDKTEPEA